MSNTSQPPVKGAHFRYPDKMPSPFISSTPPVIHHNSIIVAATHPNIELGHPKKDGWFLSDFYAFNYLLKGLGTSQTWLTAADPHKLLDSQKSFDFYLHGNPYQDRRVVLSRTLLDADEYTPVTVVKSAEMTDRFLQEVRKASERAKKENAPLVLLAFCHGLPNFELLLDSGNMKKGLSITRLKEALAPGARVTLISSACYSGGWAVTPDLNNTAIVAAAPDSTSNAWQMSDSLGRTCGSIFASTLIQTLSSSMSPLITGSGQGSSTLAEGMEDLKVSDQVQLQPLNPNEQQVNTYHAFCSSILEIMGTRVTRQFDEQSFTFSAEDDLWEYSWMGRTGIPLTHFEQRWNSLPIFPYTGSSEKKLHLDPDPSNPYFIDSAGPSSPTGGVADFDDTVNELTASIVHGRATEMAKIFLRTCPGDATRGQEVSLNGGLRMFLEGDKENGYSSQEVISIIRFRWEMGLFVDYIVCKFNLPCPSKLLCMEWVESDWRSSIKERIPNWRSRYSHIWRELVEGEFLLEPLDNQGPPFYRAAVYMTSSLVEADMSSEDTTALIGQILAFIDNIKKFKQQGLCRHPTFQTRGREWLKSLGRRIRRSMSPRKSTSSYMSSSGGGDLVRSDSQSSRRSRPGSSSNKLGPAPEVKQLK